MSISQDPSTRAITISQQGYFTRMLQHFGLQDVQPKKTPLPVGIQLEQSPETLPDDEHMFMENKPFRELLRSLMWGSTCTRADIACTRLLLGHSTTTPDTTWAHAKRSGAITITITTTILQSNEQTNDVQGVWSGNLNLLETRNERYPHTGGEEEEEVPKHITVDMRYTLLTDLLLILIADSVYDSRSRSLLSLSWWDIVVFEGRIVGAGEGVGESGTDATDGGLQKSESAVADQVRRLRNRRIALLELTRPGEGLVMGCWHPSLM
ncbi:hypothetical protein C8R41DRAFT_924722 [Lentinula lateritia]|uniref:Uncharacterized protein n=1 Tax=Lentinula lateritia TaxID=40482 RepID=A0ABQ8V2N8_9AGAR|nr:hypothetical protein C8R41DRAFT_924722 [Lentinula lateritia]